MNMAAVAICCRCRSLCPHRRDVAVVIRYGYILRSRSPRPCRCRRQFWWLWTVGPAVFAKPERIYDLPD